MNEDEARDFLGKLELFVGGIKSELQGAEAARVALGRLVSDHEGAARIIRYYLEPERRGMEREGLEMLLSIFEFPKKVLDEHGIVVGKYNGER